MVLPAEEAKIDNIIVFFKKIESTPFPDPVFYDAHVFHFGQVCKIHSFKLFNNLGDFFPPVFIEPVPVFVIIPGSFHEIWYP